MTIIRCAERKDIIKKDCGGIYITKGDKEGSLIGPGAFYKFIEGFDGSISTKEKCSDGEDGFDFYACLFQEDGSTKMGQFIFSVSSFTGILIPCMEIRYHT